MGDDINRFFPKLEQGLSFSLLSAGMQWETPSGIKGGGLFTNYYRSSRFTNRVRNPKDEMCAPDAVVLCNDINQGMYCHLVCALAQSTSIVRLYTLFSGKNTFHFLHCLTGSSIKHLLQNVGLYTLFWVSLLHGNSLLKNKFTKSLSHHFWWQEDLLSHKGFTNMHGDESIDTISI